ncbi:MAG: substrate-binding domain-containing protein [Gammaproteobacteria bacterium]|jgi:tungstate transport system substrate-binding protein
MAGNTPESVSNNKNKVIRLATTTSTENSGLLREILPNFEKSNNYEVHVIAVGTGKALRMGRDGDVDIVLVHAADAEKKFVNKGYGVNRRQVMYNDFVIVGPATDPAGIKGMKNAGKALKTIAEQKSVFVSRGDDSGTNRKELSLWKTAGVKPAGSWYREAGQGMGKVLQMTGEMQGYTLTDRGTWLSMKAKLPLQILVEGDRRLYNPYGIIAVNPDLYPESNYSGAMALITWMTSIDGQQRINDFRINHEPLFVPMAIKSASALAYKH